MEAAVQSMIPATLAHVRLVILERIVKLLLALLLLVKMTAPAPLMVQVTHVPALPAILAQTAKSHLVPIILV
jgi:hypothetical protein